MNFQKIDMTKPFSKDRFFMFDENNPLLVTNGYGDFAIAYLDGNSLTWVADNIEVGGSDMAFAKLDFVPRFWATQPNFKEEL